MEFKLGLAGLSSGEAEFVAGGGGVVIVRGGGITLAGIVSRVVFAGSLPRRGGVLVSALTAGSGAGGFRVRSLTAGVCVGSGLVDSLTSGGGVVG